VRYTTFISSFIGDMLKAKPNSKSYADKLNILIFGWAGSGKSSFINSAHTLINDTEKILDVEGFGGNLDHNTRQFKKVPLNYKEKSSRISTLGYMGINTTNI